MPSPRRGEHGRRKAAKANVTIRRRVQRLTREWLDDTEEQNEKFLKSGLEKSEFGLKMTCVCQKIIV